MFTNKKLIILLIIFFTPFFVFSDLYAANIYVDQTLSSNCTSGNYSVANRNCSGSNGNAYNTIQKAINASSKGDIISMRGGTYHLSTHGTYYKDGYSIDIPLSKQGTAWTDGNYFTLRSYPGEWAVIDGDFNISTSSAHRCGLGSMESTSSNSNDLAYWLFERFEIKECGTTSVSARAAAIGVNGGPFKFRYLYIHDNYTYSSGNNAAGLRFYHLHDSVIEYCYFSNNGYNYATTGYTRNAADIVNISDYSQGEDCAKNGFSESSGSVAIKRNIVRYNYFVNGSHSYKSKGVQCFTQRVNPDDTYKNYGSEYHHNIAQNYSKGFQITEDFAQVYNNILDKGEWGITLSYEDGPAEVLYKQITYNNTLMKYTNYTDSRDYFGINRPYVWNLGVGSPPHDVYGYDFNNLLDDTYGSKLNGSSFTIGNNSSEGNRLNLANYYNSHNYFYRPSQSHVICLVTQSPSSSANLYSQAQYQSQTNTHSPRVAYRNNYSSGNLLYQGTTGADKYKVRSNHTIESGVTIANGGIGGAHPFLSGVTLPSYVGAVNPNDNAWVDGVLGLSNVANLKNGGSGDPAWIEGSGGSAQNPPANPTGLKVSVE